MTSKFRAGYSQCYTVVLLLSVLQALEHVNTVVSTIKDPLVVVLGSLLYFISTIYFGLLSAVKLEFHYCRYQRVCCSQWRV